MNIQNRDARPAAPVGLGPEPANLEALMTHPKFRQLVRARSAVALTLTVVMLVLYYGFVAMIAFDKGALARVVAGQSTTLGIVLGFALLVATFLLVALYVAIANGRFDRLNAEVRREAGL